MKNIKTFQEFINEDAKTMINTIGDITQDQKDIDNDRKKTEPEKNKQLQDKINKQKNLKVGELEQIAKDVGDRQQQADQNMEELKKRQTYLRPEDPNAAKTFDDEQKEILKGVEGELDNAANQRKIIKKQVDKIKTNF